MRRIKSKNLSKKAFTLVELVVAMTLTAIFAASCVALILPVSKIYTHINTLSRAQILADTVVDSLREECSKAYITKTNDVWLSSTGGATMETHEAHAGQSVLVFRRSSEYCETIASDYAVNGTHYRAVYDAEVERHSDDDNYAPSTDSQGYTTSAVYRLFDGNDEETAGTPSADASEGYVHFGYYSAADDPAAYVYPAGYYDYTNPFTSVTYGDYTVDLRFHDIGTRNGLPAYVICDVSIMTASDATPVYTRSAVLSFPSSV
ncbi:MAG: prepilin-type N-terminal cleavage/methylation domain-containing protein [Saccharofermentans sp.]|nr:prepilin-type N-terminal cleavage/methylation domain-containing protein [Saccharofermentans sp.]